ncbi:MAG TPA: hypothetical protein VEW95_03330 [Candidatus Limnocylindrales bacterium]|nr:hypothetical protein [Candidatus Limnocylindrales bacterium]
MARRAGKAANRKARQRSAAQRAASRPAAVPPPPAEATATPVPPVGTPDAREAISLDPPRRVTAPVTSGRGSTLTTSERAEYHYVERDLRNIGILSAAIAVLMFLAWFAFSSLGLVG